LQNLSARLSEKGIPYNSERNVIWWRTWNRKRRDYSVETT
jgi:hypothetical protein